MRKLLLVPCCALILASCGTKENSEKQESTEKLILDYEYFEDKHIKWENALNQDYERYFVYIYSLTCSHCNEIKKQILNFASMNFNFYFVEYSNIIPIVKNIDQMIGVSDINSLGILGTPSLFDIYKGILINNVAGKNDILNYVYS